MSLRFDDARLLDALSYDLILGDWPRGLNRARIAEQANGYPPYSQEEVEENGIVVNVSDLQMTRQCHDSRSQFQNAFQKTGNYFTCKTDSGKTHNRAKYASTVTKAANRGLKKSIQYFERQRAKFGMLTLHGISPGVWESEDKVLARPVAVGDVLIPSNTNLGFENLPFFMLRRSFTAVELQQLTCKEKCDPNWNRPLVEKVLRWVDKETTTLRSTNWIEAWAPERVSERIKEDGGYFMGDQVPTIDCFDIYAYDDSNKEEGWIRRIILDSWGQPTQSGGGYTMDRRNDRGEADTKGKDDFLYTSHDRKVGSSWQNLVAFQFADLSAVFPAKYHSVRSLGWLVYAATHIGNRLRCKFYEAVFESLMQLFKVKNQEDVQRALKLNLVNKGFVDDTIMPVPQAERWQVNAQLVELGLQDNQNIIDQSGSSYTGEPTKPGARKQTEKTRFQVQAELNATVALVSAGLAQAYQYEVFEDREMFRRLCKKNSKDKLARDFRQECLLAGVPEKMLQPERWELEHERVMGGGNKTQEMQIAQWLMEQREKFDPEPQRQILKDAVLAITDDANRADQYVPERPVISESIHDTELAFGALMMGAQVSVKGGLNAIEVCTRMLSLMTAKVQEIMQTGGVGTQQDVMGLGRCGQYVTQYLGILKADPKEQQHAKQIGDVLGKVMNQVKAMAQRQQEQAKKAAQGGNGHMDPKDQAKIAATAMTAKAKVELGKQSHAAKTAQREISWQKEEQRKQQEHQLEMQREQQRMHLDAAAKDLTTAAEIRTNRLKSLSEPSDDFE
jgi:hypothetical protein